MFFQRLQRIIYLRPQGIEICRGQDKGCFFLKLPPTAVNNLEVVDAKTLEQEVQQFLETISLPKQKLVLALSPGAVFSAAIPRTDPEVEKEQVFSFFNNIPLDPENIARKVLHTQETTYVFAANQAYFQTIRDVFNRGGWEVEAVVPAAMFLDVTEETPLDETLVTRVLSDSSRIRLGNFLSEAGVQLPGSELFATSRWVFVFLGISVVLLIAALLFAALTLAYLPDQALR